MPCPLTLIWPAPVINNIVTFYFFGLFVWDPLRNEMIHTCIKGFILVKKFISKTLTNEENIFSNLTSLQTTLQTLNTQVNRHTASSTTNVFHWIIKSEGQVHHTSKIYVPSFVSFKYQLGVE